MFSFRCCLISMLLIASASTLAQKTTSNKQTGSKQQPPTQQTQPPPKQPTPPKPPETFWQKTLRILGISVTPSALKGDDDELTGDVWLFDLKTKTALRLTREGGYRSPLVLPGEEAVWALKSDKLYEIPLHGGASSQRFTINGIIKLAAVDVETNKHVLLLREDESHQTVVELLSVSDGKRIAVPYDAASDKDRQMLAYLRGWERSYDAGKVALYTQGESKNDSDKRIEWRDVYLEATGKPLINVSRCEGIECGQPALSLNRQYVVYVKAVRK